MWRRGHTVQHENEGEDREEDDRDDSGGRRGEVSGHCQLGDP